MVRRVAAAKKECPPGEEEAGVAGSGSAGEEEDRKTVGTIGVDFYAVEYLQSRGHKASLKGGSVKTGCPACGGGRCLIVANDLGTWSCEKCHRSGSFDDLRRLFGDTAVVSTGAVVKGQADILVPEYTPVRYHRDYQKELEESGGRKLEWLASLGLGKADLQRYRIGYSKEFDALVFPYLFKRSLGSTSYLRMLREPNDWWKAVGDPVTASWFGQHHFKTGVRRAVVAQTPLDAVCLAARGVENVIAPLVDSGKVRMRAHNMALLTKCDEVLICPNASDEGTEWARHLRQALGEWRCRVMQIDGFGRDITSSNEFEEYARKAVDTMDIRVGTAVDWFEEVDREFEGKVEVKGYKTRLEPLDKLLGGWRKGELSVLVGEPGAGKSTLAAFLSLLQAAEGRKVLHMSFEVAATRIVKKWVQMLGGSPVSEMSREKYVGARKRLARLPLYLPAVIGHVQQEDLARVIGDSYARYGIEFLVVDHVGFVESAEDKIHLQHGEVIKMLKRVALEFGVHVLALSHFRKAGVDGRRQGLSEVVGSGDVTRLADNVMVVRRPTDISAPGREGAASVNHRTCVDLIKVRDDEGLEGRIKLAFDVGSLRYTPVGG